MGSSNDLYVTTTSGNLLSVMEALNAMEEVETYGTFYTTLDGTVLHACFSYHFDYNSVFTRVSKQFPTTIIELEVWPEETYYNGITKIYYVNGMRQEVEAEITFPLCTLTRPKVEYRTVYVTVAGHDIPVEVEVLAGTSDEDAYKIAKNKLKELL